MADLPWKAAAVKVGQFLVLPGDEVAEVITIPEVKPGKVPVAWATIRESVHKSRIGETLIVSLFSIVEGAPQPGQVQLKKSLAEVVSVKPVEVKDLTKLSPIDYALWVESDGRITQLMQNLAGKYEDLSDKKLVSLLEERGLSTAGISYDLMGALRVQRPSVIGRLAYHEAKGREGKRVPIKREPAKAEPGKPKVERKEAEAKEPWQMTREEFRRQELVGLEGGHGEHRVISNRNVGQGLQQIGVPIEQRTPYRLNSAILVDHPTEPWVQEYQRLHKLGGRTYTDIAHLKLIEQALTAGKPVPAEVLKDYPDLVKKEEPKVEPTTHYGPPETASPEMKKLWTRVLAEIKATYPLGSPVLDSEAKRLGITPKEMQLIIADERYRQQGGK